MQILTKNDLKEITEVLINRIYLLEQKIEVLTNTLKMRNKDKLITLNEASKILNFSWDRTRRIVQVRNEDPAHDTRPIEGIREGSQIRVKEIDVLEYKNR